MTDRTAAATAARLQQRNEQTVVQLGPTTRLVALDSWNWAFQHQEPSGRWASVRYWSDLASALRSLSRRILDDELRHEAAEVDLVAMADRIAAAERRVLAVLAREAAA